MEYNFQFNTLDNFLLGIEYCDSIAEDIDSGEIFEVSTLSIGFLIFTINLDFKPIR